MKTDQVSGAFWLAVGGLIMYGATRLEVGTLAEPGPGLFSFLSGGFVALMAAVIVLRSFRGPRGRSEKTSALWAGGSWWRPLVIGFLILGYMFLLERLGFLLTSFLLLFIMTKAVVNLPWKGVVFISVLTPVLCYLLFSIILKVNLPRGVLVF